MQALRSVAKKIRALKMMLMMNMFVIVLHSFVSSSLSTIIVLMKAVRPRTTVVMHVASQTVPYGASGEHGFDRRMLVESRQIRQATRMNPGITADLPHLIFFGS